MLLIFLAFFVLLYGTSTVELYTSFSLVSTPSCSFLSRIFVKVWNYEASLRFSMSMVQSGELVVLKPGVEKPEDVIENIWFESERLNFSYSKTQNLRIYDENTYFLREKSFSLQLLDVMEFVSCANYRTLAITPAADMFSAFVSITSGGEKNVSEIGLFLSDVGVIIRNSGLYLGYVGESVKCEFGPFKTEDNGYEVDSTLIIGSGKMSWGFRTGREQALMIDMRTEDFGAEVSILGTRGRMKLFRRFGDVLLALNVYDFERYAFSIAFRVY